MPSKRGLPHAEVEVGRVDALNLDAVVSAHVVQDGAQVVDVPDLLILVIERARDVRPVDWLVKRDVFPVLSFKLLVISVERRSVPVLRKMKMCYSKF